MNKSQSGDDRQLTAREHIAIGVAVVLTIPGTACLIIATRYIGRVIQSTDFLIHYTAISLLLGLAMIRVTKSIAPRLYSIYQPNRSFRRIKQAIIFLTLLGTTSIMLAVFSAINAKLDRSERIIESSVVIKKDKRRLYKGHANYVTLNVSSTQKEIIVAEHQWNVLAEGDPIKVVILKGFLGYEHIEEIICAKAHSTPD